jgi:Flp pilus assembly pilin Flp
MAGGSWPGARLRAWVEEAGAALRRQKGQTLLEYALIIAFIGMGTVAAMIALGPTIGDAFQVVTDVLVDVSF